jgi:DNA-binding protein H-NS
LEPFQTRSPWSKQDRHGYWLRWWDAQENLLPWFAERLEQADDQRADEAQQRADEAQQRIDRLTELLRSQGIDPNRIN